MALPLEGRTALVTGAAEGIGRACAIALAGQGASLVLVDDAPTLEGVAAEFASQSGAVRFVTADFGAPQDFPRWFQQVAAAPAGIDILVNAKSASSDGSSLLADHDDDWKRVHATNVDAPRVLMQLVGRQMVERGRGGRIVSISSSSAFRGKVVRLSYGCSKAALNALTRIAAAQLAEHDINVNAVAPGVTRSALQRKLRNEDQMLAAVSAGPLENFFHRVSEPEDVAAAVLFLCLPGSRQVTGQVIHTSAGTIV